MKEEYIQDVIPGELRDVVDANGEPVLGYDGRQAVRIFIPSRVEDNPKLLESDPGYIGRLKRQAGHLARAWLLGDWDVAPGAYLETVWDPTRHVIPDFAPPWWWARWIAIDWGFAAPYSVGWYTHRPDDGAVIRYRERYGYGGRANVGNRKSAGEVAALIHEVNALHEPPNAKWRQGVGDASMWNETGTERGVSVGAILREAGHNIRRGPSGGRGTSSRTSTLQLLVHRLRNGTFLVTEGCKHWIRTVPVIAPDPDHPEDVDTEAEDHCIDETKYALWSWDTLRTPEALPPPKRGPRARPRIKGPLAGARIDPETLLPVDGESAEDAMRRMVGA